MTSLGTFHTSNFSKQHTAKNDMFPSKSLFPSHLQLVHGNKQQLPFNFLSAFCNDSFYLSEFRQPKDGYESVKDTQLASSPSVKWAPLVMSQAELLKMHVHLLAPSNGWCSNPKGVANMEPFPIHLAPRKEGPALHNGCKTQGPQQITRKPMELDL